MAEICIFAKLGWRKTEKGTYWNDCGWIPAKECVLGVKEKIEGCSNMDSPL